MTAPTTPDAVLVRAADLIEQKGWTRHDMQDSDGCLCAAGAIRVAVYGKVFPSGQQLSPATIQLVNAAGDALTAALPRPTPYRLSVTYWNDYYADDKDEVVAMLRHAADKARTS